MLGPRADGPSLAAASHVDRSATQSVTPRRYYKCSAAAGTPPHLAASLVSVFHSHSVAGNTAHAAFFRNRVSGHVSERHAFGQTVCSCLTASCHAAATAGRVWVRPRWPPLCWASWAGGPSSQPPKGAMSPSPASAVTKELGPAFCYSFLQKLRKLVQI